MTAPPSEPVVAGFVAFSEVLRRVHTRLVAEGYVYKDGNLIPPSEGIKPPNLRKTIKVKNVKGYGNR